ncbi:MAG: magnesium/cobalt transporter CorA [Pseudohongiella sp.]|nr:magnesium/cobalt transporter CorA [Pseudohongiella sp.]MDP2128827.1 magnesium/cobalt transporter CorA [Pseudohongiella sp.]
MVKTTPGQLRARLIKKRGKKVGAAPGTLVHIGDVSSPDTAIHGIHYDPNGIYEQKIDRIRDCQNPDYDKLTSWINIDGLHKPEVIRELGDLYGIHPLVQEDILNTDHRPKVEIHDDHLYVVIKMLQFDEQSESLQSEQVSLIIGEHYLLSFQEKPGDVFNGVRERVRTGRKIRQLGPDYLAYALIDAVVDNYFLLLEKFGDAIEDLEQQLLDNPRKLILNKIHHFKREMLLLRKVIWPLREVLSSLSRDENSIVTRETRVHLRDVYDHSIHIIDNVETLRDLLSGMLDLHMSSSNQRMNEIMKTLTLFATIFMPLTFIAGVYGMNFEHMPELSWSWGYPATWLVMLSIAGCLLVYFKWRRWF